jgi:hypothetical protein
MEDGIGRVKVVLIELAVVAGISIALEIAPVWPCRAIVHMPLPICVLMDAGGHANHELGRIVQRCIDDIVVEKFNRFDEVHLLQHGIMVIYASLANIHGPPVLYLKLVRVNS